MMSRLLLPLALCVSLSACVSILPDPEPAPAVYRLAPGGQVAEKAPGAEIIRVDRPSASQIFSSKDIVVTMDGRKLSTIAQSQWSEATPVVIQEAMIGALEASSEFIGLSPTSGAKTQSRLHLFVQNFEANFDNGPESAPMAVVQYRVVYSGSSERELRGVKTVRKTLRAQSINVSSIVSAIDVANDAALADIVTWLESQKGRGQI